MESVEFHNNFVFKQFAIQHVLWDAGGIARLPELGNLGVHQHFFSETDLSSMSVEEGIFKMRKAKKGRIPRWIRIVNQNFVQLAWPPLQMMFIIRRKSIRYYYLMRLLNTSLDKFSFKLDKEHQGHGF